MSTREGWIHVHAVPEFKPGDPEPSGYNEWHEWARVQDEAGYKQEVCMSCSKYRFEFQMSDEIHVREVIVTAPRKRAKVEKREYRECRECASRKAKP